MDIDIDVKYNTILEIDYMCIITYDFFFAYKNKSFHKRII